MTKKSGLFDVDFNLSTPGITACIMGEKVPTAWLKPLKKH